MDTSTVLLTLLSVLSLALSSYVLLICYRNYANYRRKDKWQNDKSAVDTEWLISERNPLIPGEFSRRIIQPVLPQIKEDDCDVASTRDGTEFNNSADYSEDAIGRIIFILQYNTIREELMVRLVQVEGLPGSDNIYNAESAYVDVELKYIGNESSDSEEPCTPPHLDICLQQVYYFVINPDQMFSHVLIFRVNTFDDSFRRTVTGEVEVSPILEMGRSVFSGKELVLKKNIYSMKKIDRSSISSHIPIDDIGSTVSSHMSWDIDPCQSKLHSSTFSSSNYQSAGDLVMSDVGDQLIQSNDDDLHYNYNINDQSYQFYDDEQSHSFLGLDRTQKNKLFASESQLYRKSYQPPSDYYHITPCSSMMLLVETPPYEDAVSTHVSTPSGLYQQSTNDMEELQLKLQNKLNHIAVKRSVSLPNLSVCEGSTIAPRIVIPHITY